MAVNPVLWVGGRETENFTLYSMDLPRVYFMTSMFDNFLQYIRFHDYTIGQRQQSETASVLLM